MGKKEPASNRQYTGEFRVEAVRLAGSIGGIAAVKDYWRHKPAAGLIMHADHGSQYASDRYRVSIKDFRMIQAMSRRANCWDPPRGRAFSRP